MGAVQGGQVFHLSPGVKENGAGPTSQAEGLQISRPASPGRDRCVGGVGGFRKASHSLPGSLPAHCLQGRRCPALLMTALMPLRKD